MNARRRFLLSVMGAAALAAPVGARSTLGDVLKAGPKPKLIKGDAANGIPDKVDFGHSLLVPMNRDAFDALWEGDDRWIAYGHGAGRSKVEAMEHASEAATGTMKLFLLTLAFAPEKLVRVDGGGWKLKSGNTADLVRGTIDLPGRPLMPTTDQTNSTSGGDAASSAGDEGWHATTGWLIWKREITLGFVRNNAKLVPAGL